MVVAPNVVVGTIQLELIQVYALIDPEATHSFIAYRLVDELHVFPSELNVGVTADTPLEEYIDIDNVYKGVKLHIEGLELRLDVNPEKIKDELN
jgi:hypothetical protein